MKIKILGTGCPKCKKLEKNAREALELAGKEAEVEKVTDMNDIMDYGVMMTPALIIDDKVVSASKVLSAKKIADLLNK